MKTKPRIFVSVPDDRHLNARRRGLKQAIIGAVAKQGFAVDGFEREQFGAGLPFNSETWTVAKAQERIRRCDGVLILALARMHVQIANAENGKRSLQVLPTSPLPTAYNHLEGALALAQHLPVFILFEEKMDRIGIFDSGSKPASIPAKADSTWIKSKVFQEHLRAWSQEIHKRRDVFLGYCSKADSCARGIRKYLESQRFTVLDWARDFRPAGATILEEIERAANTCRCGIFLFTKDDELEVNAKGKASFDAVPRDNVLLEAGYFTQARGKDRVAIVREKGAKMPADLGGIIYVELENRKNLLPVKRALRRFLKDAV